MVRFGFIYFFYYYFISALKFYHFIGRHNAIMFVVAFVLFWFVLNFFIYLLDQFMIVVVDVCALIAEMKRERQKNLSYVYVGWRVIFLISVTEFIGMHHKFVFIVQCKRVNYNKRMEVYVNKLLVALSRKNGCSRWSNRVCCYSQQLPFVF